MPPAIEREIVELHQFFQDWFNAVLPNTDAAYARFEDVMALGFHIIAPNGTLSTRDSILRSLRGIHGARPDVSIWIEAVQLQHSGDDWHLATYQEWQHEGDKTTVRLSTVLLQHKANLPNNLQWLHVHETWLPE